MLQNLFCKFNLHTNYIHFYKNSTLTYLKCCNCGHSPNYDEAYNND